MIVITRLPYHRKLDRPYMEAGALACDGGNELELREETRRQELANEGAKLVGNLNEKID